MEYSMQPVNALMHSLTCFGDSTEIRRLRSGVYRDGILGGGVQTGKLMGVRTTCDLLIRVCQRVLRDNGQEIDAVVSEPEYIDGCGRHVGEVNCPRLEST